MQTQRLPAVLVVEDEPLIRMDAVELIEEAGFPTYEAGTADAAIALLQRHDDIGVLFTDIEMPGSMDGLSLAGHVHDGWPGVVILIASGVIQMDDGAMPPDWAFFAKPYAAMDVTRALREIALRYR